MAAMRSGMILLLLAAAPAAFASTQAAQSVQGQQNSQIFGIPPLPVILGAVGAALKQINSPITLNTRVVQDPAPAQQQQHQQVYYGQAAAADDSTPQQYVSSSDQTVATTIAQPSTGGQAAAGSGYWIQNADGSRTPLSDNDPILLQFQSPPAAATGQIISGSIVAGTVVPVTTPPASQQVSWTVSSSQNPTGMQPGQGMAKGQPRGMAWGAPGAAGPVQGGNMGQMQGPMGGQMQGPMGGQGAAWGMGQGQMQGPMGGQMQGPMGGQMQGPMGGQGAAWGMGQGQGMQGPMGMASNQQGNMATWGSSSSSTDSSADTNFVQQQQQGAVGGQAPMGSSPISGGMMPGMVSEDPTAGTVIDNSNQQGSNVGGSIPPQAAAGRSAAMPTAPVTGSAGPRPAVGSGARTLSPGLGAGGPLSRRAPAMIPLNPTQGTFDGGMGDAPDN